MKTDRELLELAAKAIGLEIKPAEVKNVTAQEDDRFIGYLAKPEQWPRGWFDPLTDDGDTFRLETKMRFTVVFWAKGVEVGEFEYVKKELRSVSGKSAYETYSCHGGDKNAARRKAATHAAAKIGRAMP